MTRRMWLVVLAAWPISSRKVDWFAELGPIPYELEVGDRVAMVCWPSARGRSPTLAATVAVTKLSRARAKDARVGPGADGA